MTNRVSATLNAVRIVRPALEQFYNSLNDEQKARFNALGPNVGERSQQPAAAGSECSSRALRRAEVQPHAATDRADRGRDTSGGKQKEALDRLSHGDENAVERLQAACPDDVPLTPLGRLEAMEKRLEAMLQAAALVQPALDEFYAALSNEQKARFNTLQQVASP